ncbi:S-layer homology domain-containing protein [Pseudobacteroides cellulosolvens]|uniref:S-layer domain-containing protein n=1 Tax=Pseudobacteroides cellulosolvens ATCC 35603 = DSM 2933 TaxID=398512 RepID=A0A0L6JK15_9FIRM|nr:S-layer homology domain-containing protein [Pseudobacteroides cellulosolvens]KNY26105.1 S-layer domain-containing protein [Pseudobacteroides cellulosolvens ATCC 35603 = DSM 2933]
MGFKLAKIIGVIVVGILLVCSMSSFAEGNVFDSSEGFSEISGREYINYPSGWAGNEAKDGVLQTNIYPDTEPCLRRIGNTNVAVWLSDDRSRNAVNRTELVYSVQTEENGVWTAPKAIADDGTADFYPSIACDGEKLFVVWQNINKTFGENEASLEKMAQASDIKAAEFDPVKAEFKTAVTLIDDNVLDKTPVVSVSNKKAQVAWIRNDMNDLFGYTGKNDVISCEFDGSSWSKPKETIKNIGKIITMSAVGYGGKQYISYSVDTDDNLSTLDDREIYYACPDAEAAAVPVRLTNDKTVDTQPTIISRNNKVSVIWYRGNTIAVIDDVSKPAAKNLLTGSTAGFYDNFKVVYDEKGLSLLWVKEEEGDIEAYAALYDEYTGEMSNIVKVTKTGGRIVSLDGVYNAKGELVVLCNKAEKIRKTSEIGTYYVNGLSDLFVTKVLWEINGSIDKNSVYWDNDEFSPGKPMTISFDLKNKGTVTIRNVIIEAYDGSPDKGGKKLPDTKVINGYIKAGEIKRIDFSFTPEEARRYDVYLKAVVDYDRDVDKSDNVAVVDTGYCDVKISSMYTAGSGDVRNLMLTAVNDSFVTAKSVKLIVTEDSNTGNILFERTYSKLEKGKPKQEIILLDTSKMTFSNGIKKIFARLETPSEEYYLSNNKDYASIVKAGLVVPFKVIIIEAENKGKEISVETAVGNNYNSSVKGSLLLELYDAGTKKLLMSKKQKVEVAPQKFEYFTLAFKNDSVYNGKYYVVAKVERTTDSGIPDSIKEISNVQTADVKGKSAGGESSGGNQEGTPSDLHTGGQAGGIPVDASIPVNDLGKSSKAGLLKLAFNEGELTPEFNKDTTVYELVIDENLREIALSAAAEDGKAFLEVQGVKLKGDANDYIIKFSDKQESITIKVTAENGTVKTYTVKLVRSVNIKDPNIPGAVITLTDIDRHWARESIIALVQMGKLKGYTDNTFRPDNKITRAEAAVLLVKLFEIQPVEGQRLAFKDEKSIPEWAYSYIKAAVNGGIIKGYADNTFKASDNITRQEFAVMFLRAMNYGELEAKNTSFKDDSKIADWAKGYVAKAVELSLISGYPDNTFRSQGNISRAEASAISKKYLDGKNNI